MVSEIEGTTIFIDIDSSDRVGGFNSGLPGNICKGMTLAVRPC